MLFKDISFLELKAKLEAGDYYKSRLTKKDYADLEKAYEEDRQNFWKELQVLYLYLHERDPQIKEFLKERVRGSSGLKILQDGKLNAARQTLNLNINLLSQMHQHGGLYNDQVVISQLKIAKYLIKNAHNLIFVEGLNFDYNEKFYAEFF